MGVPAQAWGRGLSFLRNMQASSEATGLGSGNYSNQDWWGSMLNANIITNVSWSASVDAIPDNLPQSPVNPRVAARRICDNFLRLRNK